MYAEIQRSNDESNCPKSSKLNVYRKRAQKYNRILVLAAQNAKNLSKKNLWTCDHVAISWHRPIANVVSVFINVPNSIPD